MLMLIVGLWLIALLLLPPCHSCSCTDRIVVGLVVPTAPMCRNCWLPRLREALVVGNVTTGAWLLGDIHLSASGRDVVAMGAGLATEASHCA